MNTSRHTPTPWIADKFGYVRSSDGSAVAKVKSAHDNEARLHRDANAAFIVRAVNLHDQLLTIIANAYQIAGAHSAPARILDVLARPEDASSDQVEAMLPYMHDCDVHDQLVAALKIADSLATQACWGQHPENQCWADLAEIRAALAAAGA